MNSPANEILLELGSY